MRRNTVIALVIVLSLSSLGCLIQGQLRLSSIALASEFYGPGNFTIVEGDVLGDDQTAIFYVEVRGFQTRRIGRGYEFWVSMGVTIADDEGNLYVERMNEKEIHVTNATERPGMVYYKYAWYTGNLFIGGRYWVTITATDRLADRVAESRKEFWVDLDK